MKRFIFMFCTVLFVQFYANAQNVGISTTAATPDGSAMLDISSTSKGLLIPRMTQTQRNAISSPANGLMVFQTDGITGFYYYESSWKPVGMKSGTTPGEMLYWNGTEWTAVTPGTTGQTLTYCGGVPTWGPCATLPVVTSSILNTATNTSAVEAGNVISDGGAAVTARGICWSTSANPTTANSHTSNGTGTGSFSGSLTGLIPATIYHFRAYATNSVNTAYGSDLTFTTGLAGTLPSVTIIGYSLLPASIHCQVTSEGTFPVTERGVCWSLDPDPTIDLPTAMTDPGSGPGFYDLEIGSLPYYTTFYFRAYAKSSAGIVYSNNYNLFLEY